MRPSSRKLSVSLIQDWLVRYKFKDWKVTQAKKDIQSNDEEFAKSMASFKVNGKLVKETSGPRHEACRARYFENQLNFQDNYTSRKTRLEKLNFLFRMRHHVAGTPLEAKVDTIIDRVRADQEPLPPEKKAGKGKKAK